MSGLCITVLDLLYPHKFSTVLEMDYGTPFDRHTIIELSNEKKKKKRARQPGLESPKSVFTGLIRRLSKRGEHDRALAHAAIAAAREAKQAGEVTYLVVLRCKQLNVVGNG